MLSLEKNKLISIDGVTYRVLAHIETNMPGNPEIIMINVEHDYIDLRSERANILFMSAKEVCDADVQKVNPGELTNNDKVRLIEIENAIINVFEAINYDYFMLKSRAKVKNNAMKTAAGKIHVSERTLRRYISKYLRMGFDRNALIDQRDGNRNRESDRTGKTAGKKIIIKDADGILRKVDACHISKEKLDEMIKFADSYIKGRGYGQFRQVYLEVLNHYFSDCFNFETGMYQKDKVISYNRFYREYVMKHSHSIENMKRTSIEIANAPRSLLGTGDYETETIGDIYEIDECEFDIALRWEDASGQSYYVGRPVVYTIKDVLSKCIVAAFVGYENNSYVGFMNVAEMLLEKKSEVVPYVAGLFPDIDEFMPSGVLPKVLRCDHGSEYTSYAFSEAMADEKVGGWFDSLGVRVQLVPVGKGSAKGQVERWFRNLQERLTMAVGTKVGIIRNREATKKHAKNATFTLQDMWVYVIQTVKEYNTTKLSGGVYMSDILQGVDLSPINIWDTYYNKTNGYNLVHPSNKDGFLYSMMKHDIRFKLKRAGITGGGLVYTPDEEMREKINRDINKTYDVDLRYDPRSVNYVYAMKNGTLIAYPLNVKVHNQKAFVGRPWSNVQELLKDMQEHLLTTDEKLMADLKSHRNVTAIAEAALHRKQGPVQTKDVKETRAAAALEDNLIRTIKREEPIPDQPQLLAQESSLSVPLVIDAHVENNTVVEDSEPASSRAMTQEEFQKWQKETLKNLMKKGRKH